MYLLRALITTLFLISTAVVLYLETQGKIVHKVIYESDAAGWLDSVSHIGLLFILVNGLIFTSKEIKQELNS